MAIKTEHEKEYCMKCGNINPQDRAICECGGRAFVFGDNFSYTKEEGVKCDCGENKFQKISHVDFIEYTNDTYRCSNCNNTLGVQKARK